MLMLCLNVWDIALMHIQNLPKTTHVYVVRAMNLQIYDESVQLHDIDDKSFIIQPLFITIIFHSIKIFF